MVIPVLQRYKAIIEYDGTAFNGWQAQNNFIGVQTVIEEALSRLFACPIDITGAGRTDAGVHAKGQVIHFDAENKYPAHKIMDALNFYLKSYLVSVLSAQEIHTEFHARHSAVMREYEYHIINRRTPLTFMKNRALLVLNPLDIQAMVDAAQAFIGQHDLTTFRASGCQAKSAIRTITSVDFEEYDTNYIIMRVRAKSFLYNQIRSMIGSLLKVGDGTEDIGYIKRILEAKDRTQCGPVSPPYGLYFTRVEY